MDTCLEFSKTYLIFIKLLKVPRKKHKRNWERVAVVKGVCKCLSANLALQKFLLPINFCFIRTTKRLQPVIATRIFSPRAMLSTAKFVSIREVNFVDWVIRLLFCVKFLAYCGFPDIFIQVVSPKSFLFMPTRCPCQAQAQTPHNM